MLQEFFQHFFSDASLGGLIGSGVGAAAVGALLLGRNTRIVEQLKSEFTERLNRASSKRAYQEKALEQLFGPAKMQLARTRGAFDRWGQRNDHIETKIIREGNIFLRDLFLMKGHLLPAHLFKDAEALIEHYDAWLEQYEKVRVEKKEGEKAFVFVGPQGFPFPTDAEQHIIDYADTLQQALYGDVIREG